MTIDTDQGIETGRSWKDLPDEPPFGDPLEPAIVAAAPLAVEESAAGWSWRRVAAVLLVLIALLLLWLLWPRSDAATTGTTIVPTDSTIPSTDETPQLPAPGSVEEPVAEVAAALLPSVVQIESGWGVGSGFVYDERGLIFTAAHVVSGVQEVDVRFSDGRATTGTVVARDLGRDVAIVAVDDDDLTPAPLSGEQVRVGQTAIAVGSPFGLEQSVTAGVVSGLDRSLDVAGTTISGLIQTDAAINLGNSGGPLADGSGRVIGINVAIASASGGSDGVGFAVPIDIALGIAEGIAPDSPPAPVDSPNALNPFGLDPLGLDPFGDLFGGGQGLGDLDQMLDLFGDLGLLPDGYEDLFNDLDRLGQGLDRLGQDLDQLGQGPNDVGGIASGSLFELGDLPPGFQASGSQLESANGITTQVATIVGPDGTVTVRATAGAEATRSLDGAAGEVTSIRGQLGKIDVTASRVSIRWVEGGVLFEAFASADIGSDPVMMIVEGMEVQV